MNPDSFRGKVYLLVIDKVVIGALIAVALLVYDQWKTEEVRRYTAAQEEAQRAFTRAEYVKQLVPVVLDSKQDILYRGHALGALIDTHSIDAASAVHFANMLLPRVLGQYPEQPYEDYFLTSMLKTMPEGLAAAMSEYKLGFPSESRWDGTRSWLKPRNLDLSEYFWEDLLWETVRSRKDSQLELLDSDEFLARDIGVIDAMIPERLNRREADQLARRDVKALRIVGSIRLLQASKEVDPYAVTQLDSAIDPATTNRSSLELAAEVMRQLVDHPDLCGSVQERPLTIVLRREDVALHRGLGGDERSPVEDRFYAATKYLDQCAQGWPLFTDQIEPRTLPVLQEFYRQLEDTPIDKSLRLGYPTGEATEHVGEYYPIEHELIRIFINAYHDMKHARSQSEELLSKLFAMPYDKLRQAGIDRFVDDWNKTRSSVAAFAGVWKDAYGYYNFARDRTFTHAETRDELARGKVDARGKFEVQGYVVTFEREDGCKSVYFLDSKTESTLTLTPEDGECFKSLLRSLERVSQQVGEKRRFSFDYHERLG
ncbi:MAG: hypothetical protein ABSE40_24560 [Candidatus Sulfotelmatobacter sp.]